MYDFFICLPLLLLYIRYTVRVVINVVTHLRRQDSTVNGYVQIQNDNAIVTYNKLIIICFMLGLLTARNVHFLSLNMINMKV